jgi:hypothetical protein
VDDYGSLMVQPAVERKEISTDVKVEAV